MKPRVMKRLAQGRTESQRESWCFRLMATSHELARTSPVTPQEALGTAESP